MTSITYGYNIKGSCPSPPTNLGNLTYTGACPERSRGDADSRIIGVGGSLAGVNLPPVLSSATYNARNRVLTWNGANASANNRDDLTIDPNNGAAYTWDG